MRSILNVLLSIKTAFGLFLICILLCVIGSLVLPWNLAFFSGIDDTPLFEWLDEAGGIKITWWIYSLVAAMALLALSTVACTLEALMSRGLRLNPALRLPTQVMHLGVLLVMAGHLLTAWTGAREDIAINKDTAATIKGGMTLSLKDVRAKTDESGYDTDWEADLEIIGAGSETATGTLRPARPIRVAGVGFYLKSIDTGDAPSALIRVSRDPGAPWALAGGILVSLGGVGFVLTRRRPEP